MFSAYSPRAANAYQRIDVETSMYALDQHQLVSLLYGGVLHSIATARGALARGDGLGKGNADFARGPGHFAGPGRRRRTGQQPGGAVRLLRAPPDAGQCPQ